MQEHFNLRHSPFFWSRLGFCYDPPILDQNGKPVIFSRDYEKYRKFHKMFENAGIQYHTTILHSGWIGDGKYDYSLTDEVLAAVLDGNPDLYYMPRVKLNAPVEWCKNHPEDVFVYEGYESDPEEISNRCGTEVHDWFGFNTAGYPVNGGDGSFVDQRKNLNGEIALQSFSSPKWLADASVALEKLITHINGTRYAKQIIGYHIAYGMCGETALWGGWRGRAENRRGDFGITNRRMFIQYGLKKYGSEAELLKRWGVESVDAIHVPTIAVKDSPKNTLRDLFYDRDSNMLCLDYNEFVSRSNADACAHFCKIVKEATNGQGIAGAFYGYIYLPQSAYSGHLDIDAVLDSPYIDFLASPKAYFRSLAGDPSGEQCPSYSINRKKIWLDEIDNHTHLDMRRDGASNLFETRTVILREGIKNLATDQGFWWMDLGDGWYDMPEIMELIKNLSDAGERICKKRHKSVSEILLVVDELSIKSMSASYGLTGGFLYNMQSELKLCGAPVDTLRLQDLYDTDLSQYKMIVFANAYRVDERMRKLLKENAKGKLYLWNYAAGILNPDFSTDNVKELTGFNIDAFPHHFENEQFGYCLKQYRFSMFPELSLDFPLIEILHDCDMKILSTYPNGKIMGAQKSYHGGTSILCAFPHFTARHFRDMAKEAGCKLYAPVETTVYADNRIIGIFPKHDVTFLLDTGALSVDGKNKINVTIPAKGAEYYIYD